MRYEVRKPFRYEGRDYESGMPFDTARVAITKRRELQMVRARMLEDPAVLAAERGEDAPPDPAPPKAKGGRKKKGDEPPPTFDEVAGEATQEAVIVTADEQEG